MTKTKIITVLIMFYSTVLYAECSDPPCYSEEKINGNWSPDVSRVICLAGGLKTVYDDSTGFIKEGLFDELANGYKWKEIEKLKLIKTSIEEIAGTSIYNLRYKSDLIYIKYRLVFGKKGHSKYPVFNAATSKAGYKKMHGFVQVDNARKKHPTTCWGRPYLIKREN